MARARLIRPEYFESEELAVLEPRPWPRLLFAGLWCLSDREGRLEERLSRLKLRIFPFDVVDVAPMLDELERAGFIVRYPYVANGVEARAIWLPTFRKHQNPHPREPASQIPAPSHGEPRPAAAGPAVHDHDPVHDPRDKSSVADAPRAPDTVAKCDAVTPVTPVTPVRLVIPARLVRPVTPALPVPPVRPVPPVPPDASLKVITRLAHELIDMMGKASADLPEALKERCARLQIPYDSTVVHKAIDSALVQRNIRRGHA